MEAKSSVLRRGLQATILLGIILSQTETAAQPAPKGKPKAKQRIVAVSVHLNKQEAVPGEVVRITETVPSDRELIVSGGGHSTYRIGDYERGIGQMVNRDIERFLYASTDTVFEDLPSGGGGSGGKDFTVTNPREKGFEFEFKPKKLGIYLIESHWLLKDHSYLYGQPVVLVVKPPRDKEGQTLLKEEWIP
jgi:hypothetical protein